MIAFLGDARLDQVAMVAFAVAGAQCVFDESGEAVAIAVDVRIAGEWCSGVAANTGASS